MSKATVDIFMLIAVIALGLMILLFLVPMLSKELNVACKRSQIDDLGKVWRQLDNFERMKETIQPGSYNIIENFNVKKYCTSEIRYDERGFLVIKWVDGGFEKIPTNAVWKMDGSNLLLKEGTTCDFKVSLGNVVATQSGHSL